MEEATHTSRAALLWGTAATVKIASGLDCEAVSPLGSVVTPRSASFKLAPQRERMRGVLAWLWVLQVSA